MIKLAVWHLLALSVLLFASLAAAAGRKQPSLIFIVPDGYGVATSTLSREFDRVRSGKTDDRWHSLAVDEHIVGAIRSKSASSLVTDSAAAGTAFATGQSTKNGMISFNADLKALPTVLEGAKARKYNTGLVSTARVTHATPAAYSSHAFDRDEEASIAVQQLGGYILGRQVDLLWGGGRGFFLPGSDKDSSRDDDRDLISEAWGNGYQVLLNRSDFDSYASSASDGDRKRWKSKNKAHLPSLGLFTRSYMSYEIDRDESKEPSLKEMSLAALDALDSHDEPFFLMIESGRIDHAGHGNDPAAIAHETLAFVDAFKAVADWVDAHESTKGKKGDDKPEYLLFAAGDHETGGLTLPSGWDPAALVNVTHSCEYLATALPDEIEGLEGDDLASYIREKVFGAQLGLTGIADEDVQAVATALRNESAGQYDVSEALVKPVNLNAGLVWGTGDHSGVDISLHLHTKYDSFDLLKQFRGSHPNVWVADFVKKYLNLDLEPIGQKLAQDSSLGNYTALEAATPE